MSAITPEADIQRRFADVRYVPGTDIEQMQFSIAQVLDRHADRG
jgi:hypothetical protein